MLLDELVQTSAAVRQTRSRRKKTALLADCLRRMESSEVGVGVQYLAGIVPQGKLGAGYAAVARARQEPAAQVPSLRLLDVNQSFTELGSLSGTGSGKARKAKLGQLFSRATAGEQGFLAGLILGELRQGASDGVVAGALAAAAQVEGAQVRRALMVSGDLGAVAGAAMLGGNAALAGFSIQLFRPVQPMLAQPAEDIDAVFERMQEAAFEAKLDGARVQVHKDGDTVRVYSRRLNEVTFAVPEIVEAARQLPARRLILDGETLALRPDGAPHPFQVTMRRFGRRADVDSMREKLPLSSYFFDCLLIDSDDLLDRTTRERIQALSEAVPDPLVIPRIVTADRDRVEELWDRTLAQGHEGLMAKALDLGYEAGARGYGWLKLKPTHTLDLVVLAAEWGSGRRKGWLSNLHLGARDPSGGFVMLGKTFKGLTDALLTWQTAELLARERARDQWTVYVRPVLVVEVTFNDVQESSRYPGGMALRFARVKRYRPDKQAAEADTIDAVRDIFEASRS